MVDFVEKAVLQVEDKSTKTVRRINAEIKKLIREARRLDNLPIRLIGIERATTQAERLATAVRNVPKSKTSTISVKTTGVAPARKELDRLARTRSATIRADAKTNTASLALRRLTKARTVRITPVMGAAPTPGVPGAGGVPPVTPAARRPRTGPDTVAEGIREGFNPRQVGRDMARGFTFSIQGELFQITRAIVRATTEAPVLLDDALARARISGRTEDEIAFLREVATRGSQQFQAATEADIIINSAEVIGRFSDLTDPAQAAAAEQAILRLARNIQILDQALPNGGTGGAGNQARLVETAIQQLGAAQDPVRAEEISTAVLQAVIASGGDLQAGDVKRTLQQLPTGRSVITADTLLQALLVRDEGGRRSTGNFDQLLSDLIRGNLNETDRTTQLEAGVRNADGTSDLFDSFAEDFLGTVRDQIKPILEAQGIEISRENAGQIRAFLDNELGLSKQGGITFLTDAIVNLAESTAEFDRARRAAPNRAIEDPTVRQELRAVRAQFQNVAAAGLEPLIPTVKASLDAISDTLNNVQSGETSTAAAALTLGVSAIPVAIGAALEGFSDPATRPLSASALALTGSAAALNTSAAALTGAAIAQGRTGRGLFERGKRGGKGILAAAATPLSALSTAFLFGSARGTADQTASQPPPGSLEFDQAFNQLPDAPDRRRFQRDAAGAERALVTEAINLGRQMDATTAEFSRRFAAEDFLMNLPVERMTRFGMQAAPNQFPAFDSDAFVDKLQGIGPLQVRLEQDLMAPEFAPVTRRGQLDVSNLPTNEPALMIDDADLQIATTLPSNMEMAFADGSAQIADIAQQFGPEVAAALIAAAPEIGSLIGQNVKEVLAALQSLVATPQQSAAVTPTTADTGSTGGPF